MRRPNLPLLLAAAIFASATQPVRAQDVAGKDLKAVRISGEAPRLDGLIDDETWRAAPSVSDFTQQEPDNMAAPREQTVVPRYARGTGDIDHAIGDDQSGLRPGRARPGRDHVFVVKLNYWLSL